MTTTDHQHHDRSPEESLRLSRRTGVAGVAAGLALALAGLADGLGASKRKRKRKKARRTTPTPPPARTTPTPDAGEEIADAVTADSAPELQRVTTRGSSVFPANKFRLIDNKDATKKLAFRVSTLATKTTRTLTVPNANTTIVGTTVAQTLTLKTLAAATAAVSAVVVKAAPNQTAPLMVFQDSGGTELMRVDSKGENTAVGFEALSANTTGDGNTALGRRALRANTTGHYNTALGRRALISNIGGGSNTALGYFALASNYTFNTTTGLGYDAQVTGSNQVQLGGFGTTTYAYGAVQNRSDLRDKADVRDTTLGLDFVLALRPVDFRWDYREEYRPPMPEPPGPGAGASEVSAHEEAMQAWLEACRFCNLAHDGSKKRTRYHHGLIAQEVRTVLEERGIDFGGFQDHAVAGGEDVLSLGYEELVAPLIKAVQEQQGQIDELLGRIAVLESAS
jgi:hypothetical protein